MFSPLDARDDVSLSLSLNQRLPLGGALRLSLELLPMTDAPAEGTTFTAFRLSGARTMAERHDDKFATPTGIFDATEFVGWLAGSDEAEPYVLSERQARAEYEADIEDQQRGLEDDAFALASAGWGGEEDY